MTTTISARARKSVRLLQTYRPGTPIEEVQRKLGLKSVIKLASNENALGPSPKAVAALRRSLGTLHRYPDANCTELKAKLSARFRKSPDYFVIGNGSDEILVLALRAFVEPGDEVIVARPTFLMYEIQAKAAGARVRAVPLKGLRYDLPAMRKAITRRTRLIFIANPDNPTGTYVTTREVREFLRGLPSHVLVVMDEAYDEFVRATDYPQTIREVDRAPLIITRSFSKAYGLAGLRIGYGIAQPSLIRAMDAVREPFNVNRLAQLAACAALDDTEFLARTRRMTAEGMRYLTTELRRLGIGVVPSQTNFLLLKVGPGASRLAQGLLRHGVIVREMSAWKLDGCLRVTVGTMAENRRFIRALTKEYRA